MIFHRIHFLPPQVMLDVMCMSRMITGSLLNYKCGYLQNTVADNDKIEKLKGFVTM